MALRVEHENPQHAESQMGDGGVSHELLQVGLHHGHQRAIDDPDDGQDADDRGKLPRRFGEKRQAEAQHAVRSHLKENSGQDHGAGRRRLNVRIRQPGVKRKERDLDGKSHEEGQEEPPLRGRRQQGSGRQVVQHLGQIKGAREVVKVKNPGKHQGRADHGVEDKFDRGVNTALVTPDANQEIHGNEHDFPEHEEKDQIERGKDTNHSGFESE